MGRCGQTKMALWFHAMQRIPPAIAVQGRSVPGFLYGTAWKEERTTELTALALEAGFRGIDTANQRRHYFEAAVGEAIHAAIGAGHMQRSDLFLQTKFTFVGGQDHRLPYDPAAPVSDQVRQSFELSLEHLRTDYIDSYVLHGPSRSRGLGTQDWEAWRAMQELQQSGKVALLGISNVSAEQLEALLRDCTIAPAFVQNRCYARTGWDANVRAICRTHGIVYQGFSLLTANHREMEQPTLRQIALDTGKTPAQVVFRFAIQVGMIPLTGSSSARHLSEDLACFEFELNPSQVQAIERIAS